MAKSTSTLETKINPNKIKGVPYLINAIKERHRELDSPLHALLIGAGCSLQCGIPLGGDLIELCKMHAFLKDNIFDYTERVNKYNVDRQQIEQIIEDRKLRSKYNGYIKKHEKQMAQIVEESKELHINRLKAFLNVSDKITDEMWEKYKEKIVVDSSYGYWLSAYNENPYERQRFIEEIMENKEPDFAYIILAWLIAAGKFTNILTTNFDDLINEAVIYYTEQRCRFYADDELSQYISIYHKRPNIIKLHGDYRFANMKNTADETDRLTENISTKLGEMLQQLGLIVVGYNGADYSIMRVLHQQKQHGYKYPLLWCGMDANKVHWRVAQLINNTENSFFIQINNFDWLMGELMLKLEPQIIDITKKTTDRQGKIETLKSRFLDNYIQSGGEQEDSDTLEEMIDLWAALNKAVKTKNWDEFIALQTKKIDNGNVEADDYFRRAFAYDELNDYNKAINDYSQAIAIDSQSVTSYNNRGRLYTSLGEFDKAIADLDKAITIEPNNARTFANRGGTYNEVGMYDKALEDLNKAISLDPNYATAYSNRGYAYHELEKYNEALIDFNKAISLSPNYGIAHFNRGRTHVKLENFEKALADYDIAISLDVEDAVLYANRGYVLCELKRFDDALADINKAIDIDTKYAFAYKQRGIVYTIKGQYDNAIADLNMALEIEPDYWQAYKSRTELYEKMGDKEKAEQDRTKAKELKEKAEQKKS